MVKTRVHDLAAEFDIPPEQLITLLRDMDIFVRSHLSALEGDQVAAARVRWEREKRKSAEAAQPKRGRRKATAATPAAAEPAKPVRRRRTAAEVAEVEAQAQAEREEAERENLDLEIEMPLLEPDEPKVSRTLEERARELFPDVPAGEVEAAVEVASVAAELAPAPAPVPEVEPALERPAAPAPPVERAESEADAGTRAKPARAPFIPPRVARPPAGSRPTGPRPVFSTSTPGSGTRERPAPPRPGDEQRPAAAATAGPSNAAPGARRKGKKGRRGYVDQDAVQENIARTLQGLKGAPGRKGGRRSDEPSYRDIVAGRAKEEREKEKTRIRVNEFISVAELAGTMKIPATQIVQFAFKELGLMVTVNQRLDFDQIELIASEFGFEAIREQEYQAELEQAEEPDTPESLVTRPPVVTIMGHVDHGKTSLLDFIRKENIVAGEAGGITQHIGAYHVVLPGGKQITFLDTPGHQAFTAMRARGAQVTDIVVLVVAADDQVMPQTVEAISHARNAGVPMVVAINKIDLPSANVAKVKQDLLQHSVVLEEFGGEVLSAEISAKKGTGVQKLLDQLLLQAELLDLKANPDARPQGTVLEATLDPGKGPLATVLVQRGTLKVGDDFICGMYSGRVRALFDERGNPVKQAGPTIPVQVLGFDGVPSAGDTFLTVTDAAEARDIAQKRQRLEREAQSRRSQRGTSLEDFSRALKEGKVSTLPIIIKADQGGPAEALADALAQLSTSEVRVDVVLRGVGAISESDVLLARASSAIILGFQVRPDSNARNAAEREGVDVRTYRVIYEAVDDVRKALEGLLKPEEKETVLGEAEVRQLFKVSKVGTIAGSMVTNGVIPRTSRVRVIRDGVPVYTGELSSLKRFKDDVKEVRDGQECGIGVENFNDIKVGDRIEAYRMEEVKRTLASVGAPGAA